MLSRYVAIFADKKKKKTSSLQDLQRFLFYCQIAQDETSKHYLEKLLVQLLGHPELEVRDQSIIYLNMLYDGVDWEFSAAFEPKITCVRSVFAINEKIISKNPLNCPILFLSAPSFYAQSTSTLFTWHYLELKSSNPSKGEYQVSIDFKEFWRCGFYDWKIVDIDQNGKIEMLTKLSAEGPTFAQGRFIVHPENISSQQIHEIVADYKDNENEPDKKFVDLRKEIVEYEKSGITCLYIMGVLERDNGTMIDEDTGDIKDVRRPNANPLAITDRSVANKMLGGDKALLKMLDEAQKLKMKVLVDCLARISSSRPHRKYTKTLLYTLDSDGKRTLCYGADGRSLKYEDTAILNYRKLSSWNLLVDDLKKFAMKYKIDGVHLDNAQVWPQILELDDEEMYRKDPDNVPAYTPKQILDGEVVRQSDSQGYWNSINLEKYANPIFVKLCRELWAHFPEFIIIAECLGGSQLENRQGILARSGAIPRLFKLPAALASLFGKKLQRDGSVTSCHPQTVNALKSWYENNRKFTPEGAYLIQSSTSHIWPYPALLYGRGAWSAVDLLFLMPDIPMTFMGEIYGHAYRRNTTSVYQAKPMPKKQLHRAKSQLHIALDEQDPEDIEKEEKKQTVQPKIQGTKQVPEETKKIARVKSASSMSALASAAEAKQKEEEVSKQIGHQTGFDLKKINEHYEDRRRLRKRKPVLGSGKLVPLDAKNNGEWHSHVLAFARFSHAEIAIIAINFTDRDVSFFIDLSNLVPYFEKNYHENTVVLFTDWVFEQEKEYYFLNEIIHEKMKFTLGPFRSLCKGIVVCNDDPYAFAVAIGRSCSRLNRKISDGMDCSASHFCVQLTNTVSNLGSLNDFAMRLAILYKTFALPLSMPMHKLMLNMNILTNNEIIGSRFFAYCKNIIECKNSNPKVSSLLAFKAAENIVLTNKLGPIVFIAPELGRWSTVGGLGVMVDELTQGILA